MHTDANRISPWLASTRKQQKWGTPGFAKKRKSHKKDKSKIDINLEGLHFLIIPATAYKTRVLHTNPGTYVKSTNKPRDSYKDEM